MAFTKVAPAGIGTEPGSSILIGDSLLHSTGIDIGSNTGIGVTIRKHGDATFTGIITASAFFGDGSGLEGVSSSGIGTALSDDDTSSLNKIYYANQELSIGSTVTVNHPDTGIAAYTHYQDLVVKDNADFIVADGDTFIPDVLGINTSSLPNPVSSATGGRIRAGTLTNAGANGAPNFPNGVTGTAATFTTGTFSGAITAASGTITGNLGVGGVLTYEDVTNIDSVGVITARDGLRVTGVTTITGTGEYLLQLNKSDSSAVYTQFTNSTSGTSTSDGFRIGMDSNEDGLVWLREDGNVKFGTADTERLRINSSGYIKLSGRNVQGSANGDKLLRIFQPSRTDAEEDVLLLQSYNQSGTNSIIIGGGDSSFNAATDISFRTAAINTTSGTERLRIQNGGLRMNGGAYIMEVTGGSGAPNNANRQMDQRRWLWYGTSSTTHTVARVAKASSGQPGDGDSQLAAWIVTYTARSMYGFNSDGGYSVMKMRTGRFDYNDDEVRFSTEQDTLGTGGGGQNPTIVFTDEGSGVVRISITNPSSTHSFGEINLMTYDCRITLPTG